MLLWFSWNALKDLSQNNEKREVCNKQTDRHRFNWIGLTLKSQWPLLQSLTLLSASDHNYLYSLLFRLTTWTHWAAWLPWAWPTPRCLVSGPGWPSSPTWPALGHRWRPWPSTPGAWPSSPRPGQRSSASSPSRTRWRKTKYLFPEHWWQRRHQRGVSEHGLTQKNTALKYELVTKSTLRPIYPITHRTWL